jgi:hypothetical protein
MRIFNRNSVNSGSNRYSLFPKGKIYIRIIGVETSEDEKRIYIDCEELESRSACRYSLLTYGRGANILGQMLDKAGLLYMTKSGEEVYDERMLKGEIFLIENDHQQGKVNSGYTKALVYNNFVNIISRCDVDLNQIPPREFTQTEKDAIEEALNKSKKVEDLADDVAQGTFSEVKEGEEYEDAPF